MGDRGSFPSCTSPVHLEIKTSKSIFRSLCHFIAIGFECLGIKSCPLVTSLPFPRAGGILAAPHLGAEKGRSSSILLEIQLPC